MLLGALGGLNTILSSRVQIVVRKLIRAPVADGPAVRVVVVAAGRGREHGHEYVVFVDVLQIQNLEIDHIMTVHGLGILPPLQPVRHHHVRHRRRILYPKIHSIHSPHCFHRPDAWPCVTRGHNSPAQASSAVAPLKLGLEHRVLRVDRPMHGPF